MEENNILSNETYERIKKEEETTQNQRTDAIIKRLDDIRDLINQMNFWIGCIGFYFLIKIIITTIKIILAIIGIKYGIDILNGMI